MNILIFLIGLAALLIGSFTDLKKREVPDWLNYGLMFTGIGVSLLFSVIYWDFWILLSSIIGLAAMFVLGSIMFYTGQWGGGDSKMIMGIGALIGIPASWPLKEMVVSWELQVPFLFSFILYSFVVGAVYGLFWTIVLAIKHRKGFVAEFIYLLDMRRNITKKIIRVGFIVIILSSVGLLFFAKYFILKIVPLGLSILVIIAYWMYFFIKATEQSSMIKHVQPEELTEGDWISSDVFVDTGEGKGRVYITGPKDLGISKEQIQKLISLKAHGKLKDEKGRKLLIDVKIGIPFVPSFLFGYLLSYFIGTGWLIGLIR
ncbi:prepilin peptidase [Candidatus Woesearchaeota archaeon]|nr:prepilin peptidase [Candidatus Woesearchaeota archaeon]